MDVPSILATARSDTPPAGWYVWPLRRDRVTHSLLAWALTAVIFIPLFVIVAAITVPDNFEGGIAGSIATGLVLAALGIAAVGAAGLAAHDTWRLITANDHLLVMSPDDYLSVSPGKVMHVPMEHVAYVTRRGGPVLNQRPELPVASRMGVMGSAGQMLRPIAGATIARKPKQAPSLAFLDTRTDAKVVVATDNTFDELATLEEILNMQSFAKQREQSRSTF